MATILIVDDSKFMRKVLADILTAAGHEVVAEAENAAELKELYRRLRPDVVTLDIVMPEVDGEDSVSALTSITAEFPDARVVMISALGQSSVIKRCIEAGAKDFIDKPFKSSDVVSVIAQALRGRPS